MSTAQNGRTEVDEGDADEGEAEVAAVSAVLPPTTNGTGDRMPTNTDEKDVAAATRENIAEAGHLLVAIVSRGEEGDAGDTDKTMTTDMHDPLLTTVLTHFPHLLRRTLRTQHHLSLLRHRTRSLLHPLLHRLCLPPL